MVREITGEEVVRISQLLAEGKSQKAIAEETGTSEPTIRKIREGLGYTVQRRATKIYREQKARNRKFEELCRYFPLQVEIKKKPEKKRKRSEFRTPYHYPRMWK